MCLFCALYVSLFSLGLDRPSIKSSIAAKQSKMIFFWLNWLLTKTTGRISPGNHGTDKMNEMSHRDKVAQSAISESIEITTIQFYNLLDNHDWYCEMSDDWNAEIPQIPSYGICTLDN